MGHDRPNERMRDISAFRSSGLNVRDLPVSNAKQTWLGCAYTSGWCHVWTAPGWQVKTSRRSIGRCSHVFGLLMRFT